MDIAEMKILLGSLNQENISFDPHFYKRIRFRPVNEGLVRRLLLNANLLEKIELGKEGVYRYKLWYKMSSRYSLIVIAEIRTKLLKVISVWNRRRK